MTSNNIIARGRTPKVNPIVSPKTFKENMKVNASDRLTACDARGLFGAFILSISKSNRSFNKYIASEIANVPIGARSRTEKAGWPLVEINTPMSVAQVKTRALEALNRTSRVTPAIGEREFSALLMVIVSGIRKYLS